MLRKSCVTFATIFLILCAAFVRPAWSIPSQDSAAEQAGNQGIMRPLLAGSIPQHLRTFGLSRGDLLDFYGRRNYEPLFFQNFSWRSDTIDTLRLMQAAGEHGLKPANYWSLGMDDLSTSYDEQDIAQRDLVLTAATLRYASDIFNGRYPQALKLQPSEILLGFNDGDNLTEFLRGLAPQKKEYRGLQAHLADIRRLASGGGLPRLSEGPLLKPGVNHETVSELRAHLIATGDYSGSTDLAEPNLFDDALFGAVKAYQARNGLAVDGIIGTNSKKKMNTSPTERLGLVLANLERLRWEDHLTTDRHVRVNIANYRLVARDGEEDVLDMAVVVGRDSRQTPVLSDKIVSLKFSPDWTVPKSILEKDYLDEIRVNPAYTLINGFEVYQGGRVVNPYLVNWLDENISSKVTLRKPPSSSGPLGGVRFSLTNDLAIYLHDTPSTDLFSLTNRAHSSGCVRVSNPTALAEYMLAGTEWDPLRIRDAMAAGQIEVARPVSEVQVFLSYMTAYIGEDGRLQLANDPYDLDSELIARLL